jgi:acetyl-CoA decarbonylase/synthase complex subunit gamma
MQANSPSAALLLGALLGAAALGPALLPWLPGRAFAVKGAVLGAAMCGALAGFGPTALGSWVHFGAWALIIPALTSFALMNFTGASTFTSQSGVLREMRVAVPLQIAGAVLGLGLWVTGLFVGGR